MAIQAGRARGAAISSINVTPMADVIIVLLIIFMVMVPKIARQVDLPDARRGETRPEAPIVVTLQGDGSMTLYGHGAVALPELEYRLRGRLAGRDAGVTLHADEGLAYERVSAVLAACRNAGAQEVAIMTEERGR